MPEVRLLTVLGNPRFIIYQCPVGKEFYIDRMIYCKKHYVRLRRVDITELINKLVREYSTEALKQKRNMMAEVYENYDDYVKKGAVSPDLTPKETLLTLIHIWDTALFIKKRGRIWK